MMYFKQSIPNKANTRGIGSEKWVPRGISNHDVREFGATALNMELSLLLFVGSMGLVHNITKGSIY